MAKKKSRARAPKTAARADSDLSPAARKDNWTNLVNGLGAVGTDQRQSTIFRASPLITDPTLTNLYRFNGLIKRVINLPANDMTRNWFKVSGDEDDVILQKFETLGAQAAYKQAIIWGDLYGGSVILMGVDDGRRPEEPVNEKAIRNVMYLQVFDRTMVQVKLDTISADPLDPLYGQPQQYYIQPVTGGTQFTAHASRLIRFDGALLPPQALYSNQGWHDSIIQAIYEQMRQIGGVFDSAEFIVNDFVQTIIKIANLQDMLLPGNGELLKARLQMLDMTKSIANTTVIGEGEEFAKHASSVAGLPDLLDRFMMAVSAVRGIPVTLLFGRSPAGQNATGESDVRFWYDSVGSEQRVELRPRLETLIRYCFAAVGNEPETWSVEFNPLWQQTEKERSDVYKLNAEGDDIYIVNGAVSSAQVASYRFGGQTYNPNPPTIAQDELDAQENAAALAAEEKARMAEEAAAAEEAARAALEE